MFGCSLAELFWASVGALSPPPQPRRPGAPLLCPRPGGARGNGVDLHSPLLLAPVEAP
jgi:hypothetical protein